MEKSLASSEKEADSAEKKLELMEGVINKLKAGAEDLYVEAKVGSTPVLSLLGDMKKVARKHVLTFLINNINVNYYNRSGNFTQTGDTEHNEIKCNLFNQVQRYFYQFRARTKLRSALSLRKTTSSCTWT